MDYLEGLNDKQREAVEHTEGPLLILAGAGSGKTRVVTHKIAYLIEEKAVRPINILAITFTNKAATEMKERVAELLKRPVDYMWMGTFHSICVRILRSYIDRLGYEKSFTIYDRMDQKTLVKECLQELNLSREIYGENYVLSVISDNKDKMIGPDKFINSNYKDFKMRNLGEIYRLYEEKLREYNALDFDDLIIRTVELLDKNPDILADYQERFKYVFVDEYQDTNGVQYRLIKQLSAGYNNLTVVGDADQSIYGWRGADIRNILDFEKDYSQARVILLEQNYRSTSNILNLANHLIKNNSGRREKNLWTSNTEGESVQYIQLYDERDEANFVANQIYRMLAGGRSLSDFAILYRTNAQSRAFEEKFMANGIAYKIVGGLKFYDRMEIKDIVSYLRAIENPVDNISMKRIINTPKRGIGQATVDKLEDFSLKLGGSLYDGLEALDMLEIGSGPRKKLEDFREMLNSLIDQKEHMTIPEFIEEVINKSGYIEDLRKQKTIEAETRIDNIKEFISVAINFETQYGEASLEDFLANVALLSDVDKTEDTNNVVTLMTVHSAKGLEFPVVFMVGMEDGLFPTYRAINLESSEDDLEEERRLCYVAITRAESQLFITNAKQRTIYGRTNGTIPSRFIGEMEGFIESESDQKNKRPVEIKDLRTIGKKTRAGIGLGSKYSMTQGPSPRKKEALAQEDRPARFSDGDKVEHKKWGRGTVITAKDRKDGDQELRIVFETEGMKLLLSSIAPIKLV